MVIKGKALVIGCSLSGLAAADFLVEEGYVVFVTEYGKMNPKYSEDVSRLKSLGVRFEFEGHTKDFMQGADFAVTSPSVPNDAYVFKLVKELGINVISELDLAYDRTLNKNSFIGITGTNGKTTVTSAIEHILSQCCKAPACGNIGKPPVSLVSEKPDWYVTEVSSFQLEKSSLFRTHIACWTNFTPDHITWHGSLDAYFEAKSKMFLNQTKDDFAILNGQDAKLMEFAPKCPAKLFIFDKELEDNCAYLKEDSIYIKVNGVEEKIAGLSEIQLSGHHNYQNLMCSALVAKLAGIPVAKISEGIKTFTAPEHRMELVAKIAGITFYNDSKATNPESAIVAIDAFANRRTVLIAGGRDKMTSLEDFCGAVIRNVSSVVLIGEAAARFEEALTNVGFSAIYKASSMQAAIDTAIELQPDVVLLSPACASFDMFSGYEERGRVFKEHVLSKISN